LFLGSVIGLSAAAVPAAAAAANDSSTTTPALQDPQLDGGGGTFPPLGGSNDEPAIPPPAVDPSILRQRALNENSDSPMAPLPPAIVAGPIGIAVASWMAHRANRRGGRI